MTQHTWTQEEIDDQMFGNDCPNCDGSGFNYDCVDGCCVNAEEGCDHCAYRCDYCNPKKVEKS